MEISEIIENLFQSSFISEPEKIAEMGIDLVIDLEGKLDVNLPVKSYLYYPFYDIPKLPDINDLDAIASYGSYFLKTGKKVLTHCSFGYNRSGFVNGLILIKLGFTGKEAVSLIQKKRPNSLLNDTFRDFLLGRY